MVYVQVDVEHSLEAFLQGVNSEDHIVHIAETPSMVSVGMVPPTVPVDRNICAFKKMVGGSEGGAPNHLDPLEHVRQHRAVVAKAVLLLLFDVSLVLLVSSG